MPIEQNSSAVKARKRTWLSDVVTRNDFFIFIAIPLLTHYRNVLPHGDNRMRHNCIWMRAPYIPRETHVAA